MTPQEHLFMMLLFGRQNAKFNVLYEALVASGTLQQDDLMAYRHYAVEEKPEQIEEWTQQAWKTYQSVAAHLGITTGLEDGQVPPMKA